MSFSKENLNSLPQQNGFCLRGIEMNRLETFIDAAFAFATTMLVISSGKIPENYEELILALKDIPSFLLSFVIIVVFWIGHRKWSRWYGLEDLTSIIISLGLVFVLLVYIYPLSLMFSAFLGWISGDFLPSRLDLNLQSELIGLFIIYGLGLMAMAGMMAILFFRAKLTKYSLMLSEVEIIKTNSEIIAWSILSFTGFISAILAWLLPSNIALLAGLLYMTIPITMPFVGIYYSKKERNIAKNN